MKFLSGYPKKEVLPEILDDKLLLSETTQAPSETRRTTDKWFLFIFGALALVSLPLIIYTLHHSDVNRLNGYDNCGNVCGKRNAFDPNIECSGKDYTDKPYHSDFSCIRPTWMPDNYQRNIINQHLANFAIALVMTSSLLFVLTLILAAGFRYAPSLTVVGLFVISWVYWVTAFFLFFVRFDFFYTTVIIPILGAVMLCVMISTRAQIKISIMLFKESAKAVSNIQKLTLVPVTTLLITIAVAVISGITHLHMSTAGILQYTRYMYMQYVPNGLMIAAIVFNVFLSVWVVQVLLRLQNMTISSAISKWYSSRGPVTTNYCTTLKHHLGSAFLGSAVINLVSPPRNVLIWLSQISIIKDMVDSFVRCLNGFHYSYIITADQSTSFFKSSERARELLNLKVGHVTGVKYLGNIVMFLCQILVCSLSVVFYFHVFDIPYTYHFNYTLFAAFFVVIISLLSCYTLLAPIQVAYDTLFMCACEDILKEGHQNNSMSIKEFQSNAAEVLEKKIKGTTPSKTSPDAVV